MTPVAAKTSSPVTSRSTSSTVEVVAGVHRGAALVVVARPQPVGGAGHRAWIAAAASTPSGVPPIPQR